MKHSIRSLFLSILFALPATAQTIDPNAVDGEVHIKLLDSSVLELDPYDGGIIALDLLFLPYGIDTIYKPYKLPGHALDKIYRIEFSVIGQVDALLTALQALTFVEFAEKVPLGFPVFEPNDLLTEQWYLPKINATQAWDLERGSSDVLIAVVDNGTAIDHADLAANIYINTDETSGLPFIDDDLNGFTDDVNGYDTADKDADPRPKSGANNASRWTHGTHVAGTAAALTNNGTGVAGLAHGCRIVPIKSALNSGDGAQLRSPMDGVFYASRSGADVINMSWGSYNDSQTSRMVVQEAHENGAVLVAAAGNDNSEDPFFPASYPEVLSVGASDQNDHKAGFSNYGSTIDVMAPGTSIYNALIEGNNTYGNLSGTSMASPVVAGLAALVRSRFPQLSPQEVMQRIKDACDPIDQINPGYENKLGAGRVNAHAAVSVTSVAEQTGGTVLSLYPNPAMSGQPLRILGMKGSTCTVDIVDMSGRTVHTENIRTGQFHLPDGLASGPYAIQLRSDDADARMLLMVQ